MSAKPSRGTKRTCQNDDCGSRFYDLNRDPIICPICESVYEIASSPGAPAPLEKNGRKSKKPEYTIIGTDAANDTEEEDSEEALAEVAEDGAEEPAAAEADETFLEEDEEDGGDVSNIIGGPVKDGKDGEES